MKRLNNSVSKYKVVAFSKSEDFERLLNTSEEDGWKLHSWEFLRQ